MSNGTSLFAVDVGPGEVVYIEAARYFDARELARRLVGGREVNVAALGEPPQNPLPRWQVRWTGTAASNPPTLRMEARRIVDERDAADDAARCCWLDASRL